MFKHYLQTALRNLWRFKFTTAANVLCLAFGLSCFLLAYGVFAFFASSDSGFKNADRIYVLSPSVIGGPSKGRMPVSPWLIGDYVRNDFPEVEAVVRTTPFGGTAVQARAGANEPVSFKPIVAEDSFLDLFDIGMVSGKRPAVDQPDGILVGRDAAQRLFGTVDVVGKTLLLNDKVAVAITGVLDNLPMPSHLMFSTSQNAKGKNTASLEGLISWRIFDQLRLADDPQYVSKRERESLANVQYTTYLMLRKGSELSSQTINARLADITKRHTAGITTRINGQVLEFKFEVNPVTSELSNVAGLLGDSMGIPIVLLFFLCGLIVLAIALVNYINLATAQAVIRGRETGMQRLLGASRQQIVLQVFVEALLVCGVSLLLALPVFAVVKLIVTAKVPFQLEAAWLSGWQFALFLFAVLLLVSMLSAAYPALVLARFSPLHALRAVTHSAGGLLARVLVGVQFMAAGLMVVMLLVMTAQHRELKRATLANLDDPVVVLDSRDDIEPMFETLRNELLLHPQIKAVAFPSDGLWGNTRTIRPRTLEVFADVQKKSPKIPISLHEISPDYFRVMNVKRLAGRYFSYDNPEDRPAETDPLKRRAVGSSVVINAVVDEAFAKSAGAQSSSELIDRVFYGPGANGVDQFRVVGVVVGHITEVTDAVAQTVFVIGRSPRTALVRIAKTDVAGGLVAIDKVTKQVMPGRQITRHFADEQFEQEFSRFNGMMYVLSVLAVLAFSISVMGITGMVMHSLARRTHEIGIRKVLGASSACVLGLLLRDFAKPIVIANVLAWPVAFVACRLYLSLFSGRIGLTPWPFILSLAITVAIAWLSIAVQTLRAARLKPAEVLRYE